MVSSREQAREEWLKCQARLREATVAVLPTAILWPDSVDIPSNISEYIHRIREGHSEAAIALLLSTETLQEIDTTENIVKSATLRLAPTKENIVGLALALEHNVSYFKFLRGAIEILLMCIEEERQFLQNMMEDSLDDKEDTIPEVFSS